MATEPQQPDPPATPTVPESTTPPGGTALPRHHIIRRTRISGAWTAVVIFAVVLLLLLIFILQNSRSVEVSYLGAHGHLSLGVALLLAAVCGVLLIALPGVARILQLRATARRHRRTDARNVGDNPAGPAASTDP
jgi:putative membrane protein